MKKIKKEKIRGPRYTWHMLTQEKFKEFLEFCKIGGLHKQGAIAKIFNKTTGTICILLNFLSDNHVISKERFGNKGTLITWYGKKTIDEYVKELFPKWGNYLIKYKK